MQSKEKAIWLASASNQGFFYEHPYRISCPTMQQWSDAFCKNIKPCWRGANTFKFWDNYHSPFPVQIKTSHNRAYTITDICMHAKISPEMRSTVMIMLMSCIVHSHDTPHHVTMKFLESYGLILSKSLANHNLLWSERLFGLAVLRPGQGYWQGQVSVQLSIEQLYNLLTQLC